ncbi:zinc finger, C3HC4 type domain-containing protein [Babesia caballi]|uniref:Zinc finger, C3HC4 type domain-containing protein n=1 Tax=Babesia caballi TaxID=5871 RepID=A0AAV4LW37_BABCB|nr:zinc finger, C3HC4 type domain-containing protein [Babesia caballi]
MAITGGVVYYRFGSERGIWRELQLDSTAGILVSDLKILIAQETSLSKDFTRKTNLTVCLYDKNAVEEPKPLDDNVVVHVGSRVLVHRVAWAPITPIFHAARTEFEGEVAAEKPALRPFPVSLICKLCGSPMKNPVLVKCSSNCGSSGCFGCLTSHFSDSLIKNEEHAENVVYTLKDRRNCPFCTHGLVSALVHNRQMAAVLMELDFSNFDIPSINTQLDTNAESEGDAAAEEVAEVPKHFLLCLDNALVASMREHMLLPIYIDSFLSRLVASQGGTPNERGGAHPSEEMYAIVVSYVGGGTSLSPMGMVRLLEEDRTNLEFIKAARAHTAYKFEWLYDNRAPLLIPARRQPMFTYLGAKRQASVPLGSKSDVMWRQRNEVMTEVGLKPEAFQALFQAIFGTSLDGLVAAVNTGNKSWIEAAFPRAPPPMYITRACQVTAEAPAPDEAGVDRGNPFLGYAAILPFLSESQFLKVREMQRSAKEAYLQQLTAHVTQSMPEAEGEAVLEQAYNNVWRRHIDYDFPALEESPDEPPAE